MDGPNVTEEKLLTRDDLARRISVILPALRAMTSPCRLCPRICGALRSQGEIGTCGAGQLPRVAAALPHFGEEPPLSGQRGSGTVFFSHCHLRCRFCQNYEISHEGLGKEMTVDELAMLFLQIQHLGCHNLNLVSPTPSMHSIVEALAAAISMGFRLPVVMNCSGYENVEVIALLAGVIDIYLPDMKYGNDHIATALSAAAEYVETSRRAIREMFRQAGRLSLDEQGIARRGLIVRHLVLPDDLADTRSVLRFLAEDIGTECTISLMGQYFPTRKIRQDHRYPSLHRRLTSEEWREACHWADMFDLVSGWYQEPLLEQEDDAFIPSFRSESIFPFIEEKGLQSCLIK